MSIAAQPQPLTIAEWADLARTMMREQGMVGSEVVDKLGLADLDADGWAFLARIGAIAHLGFGDHRERQAARPNTAPKRHQKDGRWIVLASIPMVGADGKSRMLIDFTREDWQAFYDEATAKMVGWRKKRSLAKSAIDAMKASGTDRTRALPRDVLDKLEGEAGRAW